MVFHRRRSSHLFYTPYVFSQCQTRVKLNRTTQRLAVLDGLYLKAAARHPLSLWTRLCKQSWLRIAIEAFPQVKCLALRGLAAMATLNPIEACLGSSFPADSAKPVPLAVVSLDSR